MYETLIRKAMEARKVAYAPYSNFKVGAALLTADEVTYLGANIENAVFSATICGERVAFAKAIADGKREFKAIAIFGGKEEEIDYCYPCGICRQVMAEFCDNCNFIVIVAKAPDDFKTYTLKELLPMSFKL